MMWSFSLLSAYSRLDRAALLDPLVRATASGSWSIRWIASEMSGTRNELGIVGRHRLGAPVGQVDRVALLVEHEVERVLEVAHPLLLDRQLAVGDGVELHPLHQLLDARSRSAS